MIWLYISGQMKMAFCVLLGVQYSVYGLLLKISVRHVKIRNGYVTTRLNNMEWC